MVFSLPSCFFVRNDVPRWCNRILENDAVSLLPLTLAYDRSFCNDGCNERIKQKMYSYSNHLRIKSRRVMHGRQTSVIFRGYFEKLHVFLQSPRTIVIFFIFKVSLSMHILLDAKVPNPAPSQRGSETRLWLAVSQ